MLAFIARRIFSGAFLLLVISSLAYFLVFFTVDGVALRLLGDSATQADIAAKNRELGLDLPFFERYWGWLTAALRGDFGVSWFTNEPITAALANRLPVTVTIVGIDELDPLRGKISWVSPVARALTKAREGDVVTLRTPGGDEELEIISVEYPSRS